MNIQTLHVFADTLVTPELSFEALLSLQEETHPLLALAYFDEKKETGFFVILDIREKMIRNTLGYANKSISEFRMAYNASTSQWYLLNDPFSNDLTISWISFPKKGHSLIYTIFIQEEAHFNLFYSRFLDINVDVATLLYMKYFVDGALPSELVQCHVSMQEQRVQKESLGYAEAFLVVTAPETTVLLLLKSISPGNYEPPITRRFFLACYDKSLKTLLWEYMFEEGFPIASLFEAYNLMHFKATAMLIAGPVFAPTGQTTWIVGIAAVRTQPMVEGLDEHGPSVMKRVSHLVWIRSDGELLQRCLDAVPLRVHICVSGTTVVGVDQTNEQWRVWNWFPQSETTLHITLPLEIGVQRAYVVAREQEESQGATLWLIEQHPHEVRISCRFAETLVRVAPDVNIPHFTLLAQSLYGIRLDWHMPVGLLPCGETLIVTGVDRENHLALYQIE